MTTLRNKAVAEGGVSFYLEHFVSARIMKMTYGTIIGTEFNLPDPEHKARMHKRIVRPSGRIMLPDYFSAILTKVRFFYSFDLLCYADGLKTLRGLEFKGTK